MQNGLQLFRLDQCRCRRHVHDSKLADYARDGKRFIAHKHACQQACKHLGCPQAANVTKVLNFALYRLRSVVVFAIFITMVFLT
jgi:hypothetical protein